MAGLPEAAPSAAPAAAPTSVPIAAPPHVLSVAALFGRGTGLLCRPLAAYRVVDLEGLEALAGARHDHHARPSRDAGAPAHHQGDDHGPDDGRERRARHRRGGAGARWCRPIHRGRSGTFTHSSGQLGTVGWSPSRSSSSTRTRWAPAAPEAARLLDIDRRLLDHHGGRRIVVPAAEAGSNSRDKDPGRGRAPDEDSPAPVAPGVARGDGERENPDDQQKDQECLFSSSPRYDERRSDFVYIIPSISSRALDAICYDDHTMAMTRRICAGLLVFAILLVGVAPVGAGSTSPPPPAPAAPPPPRRRPRPRARPRRARDYDGPGGADGESSGRTGGDHAAPRQLPPRRRLPLAAGSAGAGGAAGPGGAAGGAGAGGAAGAGGGGEVLPAPTGATPTRRIAKRAIPRRSVVSSPSYDHRNRWRRSRGGYAWNDVNEVGSTLVITRRRSKRHSWSFCWSSGFSRSPSPLATPGATGAGESSSGSGPTGVLIPTITTRLRRRTIRHHRGDRAAAGLCRAARAASGAAGAHRVLVLLLERERLLPDGSELSGGMAVGPERPR